MHEMIDELYQLCDTLDNELVKANEKLRMAGGELSGSDLEYVDKLTHAIKSIKTTIAMAEAEDDGYSFRGGSYASDGRGGNRGGNRGGSSRRGGSREGGNMGGSREGGSYAGRRGNVRRDSMGRYSREGGYSYAEDDMSEMLEEMRGMMGDLPADKQQEVRRFLDKMERM